MQLSPMTFNEPGTDTPFIHWIEYYKELDHEIPEGELGLNREGMSRSEGLEIIYMFENLQDIIIKVQKLSLDKYSLAIGIIIRCFFS